MENRFPQFTIRISRLHKLIQKLKTQGMGHFGLKAVDTLCLYQLSWEGSLSFREVAERCDLDGALVSRTLSALVKADMVQKEGAPGKYHARYSLTPEGAEETREMLEIIDAIQAKADEGIDPRELQIFYGVLGQLTENFQALLEQPDGIQAEILKHQKETAP